jgi:UDPglucose--hexose-1-phosphate uridylyltransferase
VSLDVTWEQRWHPLLRRWVTITSHRGGRPWVGQNAEPEHREGAAFDAECYLCPGNVRVSGLQNPDYSSIYCFDNDHPALGKAPPASESPHPLYRSMEASGQCRVMCYHPNHSRRLSELEPREIEQVTLSWARQTKELTAAGWEQVFIFENNGSVVGVSNPHPHCQIYAFPFAVDAIRREIESASAHYEVEKRSLFDDIIEAERMDGRRMLLDEHNWAVFVPYFAQFPFEMMLLPHRSMATLAEATDAELKGLASALRVSLQRLDRVLGQAQSYILSVHQAPSAWLLAEAPSAYSTYVHIQPFLRAPSLQKFLAGIETAAGQFLNDAAPEEHADALRRVVLASQMLG